MMFNKIFQFSQNKLNFLYRNSIFIQNIDKLILPFILLTFISSTFMNSDYIGFLALIIIFLTMIKMFTKPESKFEYTLAEIFLIIYFMLVIVSLFGSTF